MVRLSANDHANSADIEQEIKQIFFLKKKVWSEDEDKMLKRLYEEEEIKNWSLIAKKMSLQLNLPRKSSKQCRQRYQNHINAEDLKMQWTIDEEMMLIQYHNQIGNKWSLIAQKIPGKTDNCVKNHFYSKLRKILRKLNMIIQIYFRKQFRQINISVIYKIVQACEELFKPKPYCEVQVSVACRQIQNKMLNLSMLKEEEVDSEQRIKIYHDVIQEIIAVSKIYKRRSKKNRKNSIIAPNIKRKSKKQFEIISGSKQFERGYLSDSSSVFDEEEESELSQKMNRKDQMADKYIDEFEPKIKIHKKTKNEIVVKHEQQEIKDLLINAGVLQFQNSDMASVNGFKASSRSSFKSYSQNQNNDSDPQFCKHTIISVDDSEAEGGFLSKIRRRSYFKNIEDPSQKSEREGVSDAFFG